MISAGFTTASAPDEGNLPFMMAAEFVCDTNEHLFLTGKAGSGKTTFLKYIRQRTRKKCAVVAPTGIAAINAGGETIHSFLQLPFGPFVPGNAGGFGNQPDNAIDKHALLARLKLRDTKLQLLRKLELLIIDEVSMVRADLLDAMDLVLRHVRKRYNEPFGGVQMLYIGDLFQLPPVAQAEEWEILRHYYGSTFFFDAHVLRQYPPLYIELKKVYRQKDAAFIELLNRVRTGETTRNDIELLNSRYRDETTHMEGYIMLCTHNHIADDINQRSLELLSKPLHKFDGKITPDFNPRSLPAEQVLHLKEGAQVMFIKNDLQTPRRYYNGKIAVIHSIKDDAIRVTFPGEEQTTPLVVPMETWKNIRYSLDRVKGEIVEDEAGSFQQYPLRLAWAITVHKSQGLTLEKAIVDLNRSFASGQVYVALSRCVSIDGLVLRSRLHPDNVLTDQRVIDFANAAEDEDELDTRLQAGRQRARLTGMVRKFSFHEVLEAARKCATDLSKRKTGPMLENQVLAEKVTDLLDKAEKHASQFHNQLYRMFEDGRHDKINDRGAAACIYFTTQVLDPIIQEINTHLATLETFAGIKKQQKLWKDLNVLLEQKKEEVMSAVI